MAAGSVSLSLLYIYPNGFELGQNIVETPAGHFFGA